MTRSARIAALSLLVLSSLAGAGPAGAQDSGDGTLSRQEIIRQDRLDRRLDRRDGSSDGQRLDQLLRMRDRGERRARQFRQRSEPAQRSRPANGGPGSSVVRTE